MMMEIMLDEKKAKENNIDIKDCYEKIDNYFLSRGVKKISTGVYQGTDQDFSTIMIAQTSLPKTPWFLKVVREWYCRYLGDAIECREDALESYYRIKAQNARFHK